MSSTNHSFYLRINRFPQFCQEPNFTHLNPWPAIPNLHDFQSISPWPAIPNLHDFQSISLTNLNTFCQESNPQMEISNENCKSGSDDSNRDEKGDHRVAELPRVASTRNAKSEERVDRFENDEREEQFDRISEEFDRFLGEISNSEKNSPQIPDCFEKFMTGLETKIKRSDSGVDPINWHQLSGEGSLLLDEIDKVCKLNQGLGAKFSFEPNFISCLGRIGVVLQLAMAFLEEEFRLLLEESATEFSDSGNLRCKNSSDSNQDDRCVIPQAANSDNEDNFPTFPPEILSQLARISKVMFAAGYETECCQVYSIARRNFFDEILTKLGVEKISIEDVQKMNWDDIEGEIVKWIKAYKKCITVYFPGELQLCESVFSDHPSASAGLFSNLARGIIIQLLNFAEAVAMAKRTTEKLFKFLDMYEALRDQCLAKETAISGEIMSEISSAKSRLGAAVVGTFADFVNSIQGDNAKTPVPGGAVHPITRYVMNYLKYACAYKDTLEQLFQEHDRICNNEEHFPPETESQDEISDQHAEIQSRNNDPSQFRNQRDNPSPFSIQLMTVMDLLASNLEYKSKLYKDLSLSNIFLMNNGRYIVQKIKGSEIYDLLGDPWYRKRSGDLRQYHKNYQRETWSKVLQCLKDEGLQNKGNVSKPVLKERFKTFNAMFEEIHKTQSCWFVSDDQLQSELRVSISAVVIPAYRSFLGRFRQHLDSGRQSEKYIKFGPEDLETYIDELFEGTPASIVKRKA